MLIVECNGSPFESKSPNSEQIGVQHGTAAKIHIERCIAFYASLFQKASKLDWPAVQDVARRFEPHIQQKWPNYYEEMQGVAQGSGRSISDIIALNVRTEIAFGSFSDGCTSLAWQTEKRAYLGQNWDWKQAQQENLIVLKIQQAGKPAIQMISEAGIIGKIGLNSAGVGVCLNAIRAQGMDPTRLPVHLGLRMVLESATAKQAVAALESYGLAAAAHMLIADPGDAVGLEVSALTTAQLLPDALGRVVHSNHFVLPHPGVVDTVWIQDSLFRIARLTDTSAALAAASSASANPNPSWAEVSRLFEDEENAPTAICRSETGPSDSATLFNILMDLRQKKAVIRMGKPCHVDETVTLEF
ncbi:hypothetical protein A1O3_01352 [Capronia epimyces CBS 606.96]|uniref:Peptidase C45 hydrolase domain-containing protein n=1 Tax=Capronia epimyces CBS 606.96 TaxID=1182542 RepID=W9YJR8_9EURO|nr:uncharacterized protein A1O3_01352 [Capronia epimyces CBS 606.96]EXJ92798.1 hypothetical protein A1O3_01352 [Capronia epimyces CBS 606.96]